MATMLGCLDGEAAAARSPAAVAGPAAARACSRDQCCSKAPMWSLRCMRTG